MATRRAASIVLAAAALVGVATAEARAQFIEGPIGAIGGVLGGRRPISPTETSQTFDLTFDFGSGFDHDPTTFLTGSPDDLLADNSTWFAATTAAAMRYRVGTTRRSVTARGRSYFNYQSAVNDSLVGAEGAVLATSAFGPRQENRLSANLQASYEPRWAIGLLQVPDPGGVPLPSLDVSPPTGVFEQRWLYLAGSADYQHQWSRSHTSIIGYGRRRLEPVVGTGLESTFQQASFDHTWAMGRAVSLVAGYRYDENSQRDDTIGEFPVVRYQTADAGLTFSRRLSPVRNFSLSLRGGATNVFESDDTSNIETLHPSATALAELSLSPRFGVAARVARAVTVLPGASALPMNNDMAEVSVQGTPTTRLQYSANLSFFRAEFLAPTETRAATADVAGFNGEMRYALTRWLAAFGAYAYYRHRIDDETLVSGFPSRYERHSLRVGVTLWLPVYGAF